MSSRRAMFRRPTASTRRVKELQTIYARTYNKNIHQSPRAEIKPWKIDVPRKHITFPLKLEFVHFDTGTPLRKTFISQSSSSFDLQKNVSSLRYIHRTNPANRVRHYRSNTSFTENPTLRTLTATQPTSTSINPFSYAFQQVNSESSVHLINPRTRTTTSLTFYRVETRDHSKIYFLQHTP